MITAPRGRGPRGAGSGDDRGERIQKALARAGLGSRRQIERWLAEGRIAINGSVITTPGTRVDLARDHVKVDGRRLRATTHLRYLLLNKPDGVVTTMRDPQGRRTVADCLRGVGGRVFPVGRLDFHTTGLLLLTNDGDLADRLMRPATGCPKVYRAKVRGAPSPETLERLSRGVLIDGRATLPCIARAVARGSSSWVEVVLREGRRNQIRRMFARVGHPVVKLHRRAIGPLTDRGLPPGRIRPLTEDELRRLKEALE